MNAHLPIWPYCDPEVPEDDNVHKISNNRATFITENQMTGTP